MAARAKNKKKTLNDFFALTSEWILKLYRNIPWVTLYQNCSNRLALFNKMATRAKNRKTFKRLLLLNQRMDFEIIMQECFLGDVTPYQTCSNRSALLAHLSHRLRVSYCHWPMSVVRRPSCVVRRPSCVVNNCFKQHLL